MADGTPSNKTQHIHSRKGLSRLEKAINSWTASLEPTLAQRLQNAINKSSWTYCLYPPLLLLPPGSLDFLSGEEVCPQLTASLCHEFHVTHIAINAPISEPENPLRAPLKLIPVHGDFGSLEARSNPDQRDFDRAFWCTARQNGIQQVWAPLYTMFSRGNVKEKIRLLQKLRQDDRCDPAESSAVDLYAGIGYFAFCYARAGFRVLCWELNPWSVEGLRRGAQANRWAVAHHVPSDCQLTVLQEDNLLAEKRIAGVRKSIPPVRHVNCGLLPTSRGSWKTAVACLDPDLLGWIHVHENVLRRDIPQQTEQIVEAFETLADKGLKIHCPHVEVVKSFAPGVVHCVFDISISK